MKIEAAQLPCVDPGVLWERMDAHGISQNEAARRASVSGSYLSQVMNGQRIPSGTVLRRLHDVLFAPSPAEQAPVELKVLGWKKGSRNGVVIRGAGGPRSNGKQDGGTIHVGGRAPWARTWSKLTPLATTVGAGCRCVNWWTSGAAPTC